MTVSVSLHYRYEGILYGKNAAQQYNDTGLSFKVIESGYLYYCTHSSRLSIFHSL